MTKTTQSNQRRIASAGAALAAFQHAQEAAWPPLPQAADETLIDILTDLRHWAASNGIDFRDAVRISEYHYEEECDGDA